VMGALERTVKLLRDALWHEPSAELSWLTDPPALTTIERERGD
jgi:hypothetical protein